MSWHALQVSVGVHETEEEAARQYDRALIVEKGRSAKTNFPMSEYDQEMRRYNEYLTVKYAAFPFLLHRPSCCSACTLSLVHFKQR